MTEAYREWNRIRHMAAFNLAPSHPQGVGMTIEMRPHEAATYRYRFKHHYAKWSSLPDAVKAVVRADLGARA